jgi:hypothetical protein
LENLNPAGDSYNFTSTKAGIDKDIEEEPLIKILLDKFNGELLN